MKRNIALMPTDLYKFFAVPPRISPFSFEDGITEGLRTQLMCSSSQGDQPFNITWLKDHRIIFAPNRKTKQQKSGDVDGDFSSWKTNDLYYVDSTIQINEYAPFSSILSIENLTSNHNGNYTCRISNTGGVVDHTAVLVVAGSYTTYLYFTRTHYTIKKSFKSSHLKFECLHNK